MEVTSDYSKIVDTGEVKSYCGEELIDANGGEVREIGFQSNS